MRYYIELTDITDTVSIDESENIPANEYEGGDIVNDTPESYPDLEFTYDGADSPLCYVNSELVGATELIAGAHPPQRPR